MIQSQLSGSGPPAEDLKLLVASMDINNFKKYHHVDYVMARVKNANCKQYRHMSILLCWFAPHCTMTSHQVCSESLITGRAFGAPLCCMVQHKVCHNQSMEIQLTGIYYELNLTCNAFHHVALNVC